MIINQGPQANSTHLGNTWIEPEELAYNTAWGRRRGRVVIIENKHHPLALDYGTVRIVSLGIPDTFSSIPARLRVRDGATVRGFVHVIDCTQYPAPELRMFAFTPEANPETCTHCNVGEGCKTRTTTGRL